MDFIQVKAMRKFKYFLEFLANVLLRFGMVLLTVLAFISIAIALFKLFTYKL